MPDIRDAMCLTITPHNNSFVLLEYVTPIPKIHIADWDTYIHRQRVAAKSKTMLVTVADKYYNDVLNFDHGSKFLIENKRVMLHPIREFKIPTGMYNITIFKEPITR